MSGRGKLVRDRIPELIAAGGKRPVVRELGGAEYTRRLDEKLAEHLASGDPEERADLVDVVRAIAELQGIGWDGLERIREAKRTERDGLNRRSFLAEVEAGN